MHNSINVDPLSPELRKVESEIDKAYLVNDLVKLEFAPAAWYLLATAEDSVFIPIIKHTPKSMHDAAMMADRLLTHMQYPIAWLYKSCSQGGKAPFNHSEITYQASLDLLDLAARYKSFVAAFTYASQRKIDLKLDNNQIIVNRSIPNDTRYEAYNRLLKASVKENLFNFEDVFDIVSRNLKVSGDRFEYKLTPQIVDSVKLIAQPLYDQVFKLPRSWNFSRYGLGQFLDFSISLAALAILHWSARYLAAASGCKGLGYCDSIRIFGHVELIKRLTRYSGLSNEVVSQIVEDLTYGKREIRNPDPALQPIIPLSNDTYALSPWIWMSNSIERNFTVLLNKMPSERKIYAKLIEEKESFMRTQIVEMLPKQKYRYKYGEIPNDKTLPDIDLAIVSDIEKVCLILELKWFIEPADIGEVISKTEELQKGVSQLNRIQERINAGFDPLFKFLGIEKDYFVGFAVVSANWIGFIDSQDPHIPIINQQHLIHKFQHTETLRPILAWLNERKYLPTEGSDYKVIDDVVEIANWKLTWYGIKPLIDEAFLPL